MYDRREWRFPPVIATEGSTYGGWRGVISEDALANDLTVMGQYMNADNWWCGYTNFAVGIQCNGAWVPWDIVYRYVSGGQLISQFVGDWNEDHPADAKDGLYSQMFGAGKVHPGTVSELTPAGLFNGGVNRVVTGLTPGEGYLLLCWMKYEFRGIQPDQLAFYLGVDPTGQTGNGNAGTIDWGDDHVADKAPVHEIYTHVWRTFNATGTSASIWLRASHPVANPSVMCYVDQVEVRQLAETSPLDPFIVVEPAEMALNANPGENPPDGMFTVRNAGEGTINYTITPDCNWVTCDPSSGASSGEPDTITIHYNTFGLTAGQHVCTITVAAPEAINSPVAAPVITLNLATVAPDFDGDGDVDGADFGHLQICYSGEGVPQTVPACQDAKLDIDDDVDLDDYAVFQNCMSGADLAPDPGCAG
jgi:hypothetical protein